MSLQDCANQAVKVFRAGDAVVAVAIAGAESTYNPQATGDALTNFVSYSDYAIYAAWSVGGWCSFGYWQILLRWHYDQVGALSGFSDAASMASWLLQPENNARAALAAFQSGGWGQWTTYNNGAYQAYLSEAQTAVNAALEGGNPVSPGGLPVPSGLYVLKPASASAPYAVTLDWADPAPDQWIDISTDPNFSGYSNKHVGNVAETVAPDGFSQDAALLPETTYYWRIWNGETYAYGPSWNVPTLPEAAGPPAPPGSGGFSSGAVAAPAQYVYGPLIQPGPGLDTQPALGDVDYSPAISASAQAFQLVGQSAMGAASFIRDTIASGG